MALSVLNSTTATTEHEDICAVTVCGRPGRKDQTNMLINYLNGVGRSVVDCGSPHVMDEEPMRRVAPETCSHMWRFKKTGGLSGELRVTRPDANLMPFHPLCTLSSAQIQNTGLYGLWK